MCSQPSKLSVSSRTFIWHEYWTCGCTCNSLSLSLVYNDHFVGWILFLTHLQVCLSNDSSSSQSAALVTHPHSHSVWFLNWMPQNFCLCVSSTCLMTSSVFFATHCRMSGWTPNSQLPPQRWSVANAGEKNSAFGNGCVIRSSVGCGPHWTLPRIGSAKLERNDTWRTCYIL